MRTLLSGPLLLALSSSALACSAAHGDCSCLVENSAARRALACGETACVGGTSISCADRDQIVEGGQCLATRAPSEVEGNPTNSEPPAATQDQSCLELQGYCTASCAAPASTAADCQATASAGDLEACRDWPLVSGVLCRP